MDYEFFDDSIDELLDNIKIEARDYLNDSIRNELINKDKTIEWQKKDIRNLQEKISDLEKVIEDLNKKLEDSKFQECGEGIKTYSLEFIPKKICRNRNYDYNDFIDVTLPDGTVNHMQAIDVYGYTEKRLCYACLNRYKLYPIIIEGKKKYLRTNPTLINDYDAAIVCNTNDYLKSIEEVKRHALKRFADSEWSDEFTEKYCKEE